MLPILSRRKNRSCKASAYNTYSSSLTAHNFVTDFDVDFCDGDVTKQGH